MACATSAAAPVAQTFVYRRTAGTPRLVPGSTLHVAGVACDVHVEPDNQNASVASREPVTIPGSCRTYNMHGMLEQMPTTRWLAASFKIAFDELTSRDAAKVLEGWKKRGVAPKDRVLIVITTDDAPPVYDDGCQHVNHPCDPGPRRVVDEGHHQTIQLYILGTAVPTVIDPSALQPLLGLLGWERIEVAADAAAPAGATRDAPAGLGAFLHAP